MYKVNLYKIREPKEIDADFHKIKGNFVSFYKLEKGGRYGKEKLVISYNSDEVLEFKEVEE